ncbi:MAG TPA: transglutaminase-like domain-containing protein [Longimicrobiales bacterium]
MRTLLSRRAAGVAILLFWAGVIGMHVRREYFKPLAMRLEEGARTLAPGSYYYVVRMQGHAMGVARSQFDTVASGFVFQDNMVLDVPALDTVHRASAQTRVDFGKSLQMQQFKFNLTSEIGRFDVTGTMRADSQLDIRINAGGKEQRMLYPAGGTLMLDAAVPLRLAAGKELTVGRSFTARVFDPSTMSDRQSVLRVTARDTMIVPDSAAWDAAGKRFVATSYDTIPVWRIEQQLGSIKVGNWVDEDGHLVKAESPLGFTVDRTAYELADQEWKASSSDPRRAAGYGAVIEQTAIASNVDLGDVASTAQLRVRLKGVDLAGFDLSGGRQQLRGDTLVINREAAAQLRANYSLPYGRGDTLVTGELVATPLIQSNDPGIRRTARRATSYTRDPAEAARLLNGWVHSMLRKEITLSVPSALQVLAARQGDCNEHTVLYVALARSIGLPARTAVGLVHVRGRFYYHAWPEVYLNGGWVAVDPTLGQYPADASHLRFLVGGLARQVELIRLIGRLQLEVERT